MVAWLRRMFAGLRRMSATPALGSRVPPPPFLGNRQTGTIMNGLWCGKLTPDEARHKARAWGFPDERIEEMVARATQPPSYWARHAAGEAPLPVAIARRRY
jgi:hypothetical protein